MSMRFVAEWFLPYSFFLRVTRCLVGGALFSFSTLRRVVPTSKALSACAFSLLLTQVSNAGIANQLEVDYVRVDRDGKGLVRFTTPLANVAGCVNGHTYHLSFNASTEGGKAVQALLLTALASGRTVYAQGTNSCLDYANTVESWNWGYVK